MYFQKICVTLLYNTKDQKLSTNIINLYEIFPLKFELIASYSCLRNKRTAPTHWGPFQILRQFRIKYQLFFFNLKSGPECTFDIPLTYYQ